MPSSDPVRRFRDIVENVDRIENYLDGYDFAQFTQDPRTIDAIGRCMQRITEVAIKA
ncbi:HepT-like ribonuclease domain-containing protein [uncultured Jannaschia sp.]|uniref:HepT-like ribonuclease domain-containing protein n=1 Tax=uncultured Jannaschia sp. TaxID=293347 RepID=UPI002637310F|nr:HepT-like ribonuclease domain-containing protein [uncultured Jannaschia sp.]